MTPEPPPPEALEVPETTVRALVTEERLGAVLASVHAGTLERKLLHPRVQKNGLVLAGHFHGQVPTRVQVFGETEMSFLADLDEGTRRSALDACFARELSCVVVTGVPAPGDGARSATWTDLHAAAARTETSLFFSPMRSSVTINLVHAALDDLLAPHTELHGVLVDVYGVGLLLRGLGGIGKSECALELIMKGHRLVADDVVRCDYRPPGVVFGMPAPLLRHHMEIRGLGILNIRELFGVTSVRERKRIDVIVRLVEWREEDEYDRLGVDDTHDTILGVPLRALTIPVRQGRDMGTLLEIAARDELLRRTGVFSARRFVSRIERGTLQPGAGFASPPLAALRSHVVDPRPRSMPLAPESSVASTHRTGGTQMATEEETSPQIVVVTGVSGAGKSTALRSLEDLGFYCVDNLPTMLAPDAVRLSVQGGLRKVALGIDVRVGSELDKMGHVLDALQEQGTLEVLFCDASDETLLRRFSETRRPHALASAGGPGAASVARGVELERGRLAPLRARATRVIDTTTLSVHELRRFVFASFGPQAAQSTGRMRMRFVSFGFKYGNPVDADLVFDVRFLDNPYFVPGLRQIPGSDPRVRNFVLALPETGEFLAKIVDLLTYVLPKYEREGKSYLTVAVGCTGGRHRSVVVSDELARHFGAHVDHRDVAKGLAGKADPDASGEFGPSRELSLQSAPVLPVDKP